MWVSGCIKKRRKSETDSEREGERDGGGGRIKRDHKDRVKKKRKNESLKSARYLGYCLTLQSCWEEGCVLNMTVTGHNKDT